MSIPNPQIPEQLNEIDDFEKYSKELMQNDEPITEISCISYETEHDDFNKIEVRSCVFDNCSFRDCDFESASFYDVVFKTCDFSNSNFQKAYFSRCKFIGCKCVGANLCDTIIKQTTFLQSNFRYSYFDKTKMTDVLLNEVDLTEASIAEAILKRFSATDCRLIKNNLFKTMLSGIDFTKNDFSLPIISSPPIELKGAVINSFQAADIIRLFGVIIDDSII